MTQRWLVSYTVLSALLGASGFAPANASTLREFYEASLEQSELVQSAELDTAIARENKRAVETGAKPRVLLSAETPYRFEKYDSQKLQDGLSPAVRTEFRQPLYDGGTTAAQVKNSESLIRAAQWDALAQKDSLYLQCAVLFYDLLLNQDDLKNLRETENIYRERVGLLSGREKIGRSRSAEVLAARTQLELTRSQIVIAETARKQAEDQLVWLSGIKPPLQLDDDLAVSHIRQNLAHDVPPAAALYPSIEAAQARRAAAEAAIDVTRATQKPQIDFIASHQWDYLDMDEGRHTFDFGFGLTWQLYDAGLSHAETSRATLIRNQAALDETRAGREANLALSIADSNLAQGLAQIDALQAALNAANRSIKVQQAEYETGLITNLEFNTALDQRLAIKRSLDQSVYRTKIAFLERGLRKGQNIYPKAGTLGEAGDPTLNPSGQSAPDLNPSAASAPKPDAGTRPVPRTPDGPRTVPNTPTVPGR